MSGLREEFIVASQLYVGSPFKHHFLPDNTCSFGRVTNTDCMERGLDAEGGFDCSGLVIASMCMVQGIDVSDWPPECRHLFQLERFAKFGRPEAGDVALMQYKSNVKSHMHMGVITGRNRLVHATDRCGKVYEDPMNLDGKNIYIPAETLATIAVGGVLGKAA